MPIKNEIFLLIQVSILRRMSRQEPNPMSAALFTDEKLAENISYVCEAAPQQNRSMGKSLGNSICFLRKKIWLLAYLLPV